MEYSTQQGRLIMPEYGRNVQNMVAHALTIADKEERTRCVNAIMQTMQNLFPYLKDDEACRHKIYDHLAIMSDFQLDIDWPFSRPEREEINRKPEPLPYPDRPIRFMHYGRMIENMVNDAIAETDLQKRQDKIVSIANLMKRNFLLWNKDQDVNDERIKSDLRQLSDGQLDTNFENFHLLEPKDLLGLNGVNNNNTNKKKKKK